jgi:hypothetical protein
MSVIDSGRNVTSRLQVCSEDLAPWLVHDDPDLCAARNANGVSPSVNLVQPRTLCDDRVNELDFKIAKAVSGLINHSAPQRNGQARIAALSSVNVHPRSERHPYTGTQRARIIPGERCAQ